MARKRIKATIPAIEVEEDVAFQKVVFQLNGETIDTQTVGPEGGEIFSSEFDLPDNQANLIEVLVTPVDRGGLSAPAPSIASQTFKGADTIPPNTPANPPTFVLEDVTDSVQAQPAPEPASAPPGRVS